MHNEGAPRHHAGAPGPLLYLKLRCERIRSRAQRIRSPGSLSVTREAAAEGSPGAALRPRRVSCSPRAARKGFLGAPPRPGSSRAEGEGTRTAGPREGGQRTHASQEAARCESRRRRRRRRRGAEPRRKESPQRHNGSAGAEQNAPAAPRGPAAPPRPRGPQPPGAAVSASRHCRGPTGGALCGCAFLGSHRSPSESRPSASSGAPACGAYGFMKTLMQEVGRTRANFSTRSASAAPCASSPLPSSPGGRRCPRWWQGCWAAAAEPAGGPCRAPGCA